MDCHFRDLPDFQSSESTINDKFSLEQISENDSP